MKKLLALVMAASMALSLAACGGNDAASTADSTATESTSTEATAEEAATTAEVTGIAQVCDVGTIDDVKKKAQRMKEGI